MESNPCAAAPLTNRKRTSDVLVENWAVVAGRTDTYQAPELWPVHLTGMCYNHPDLADCEITSSNLHHLDEGEGFARSMNTQFRLGTPSKEFVDWMVKNKTTRPYRFYSADADNTCAPKRVHLQDLEEDRDEEEEESAGTGMGIAERWLKAEDWNELHPGCPMSWMSEVRHERWVRDVRNRKEKRKQEHRAARDVER